MISKHTSMLAPELRRTEARLQCLRAAWPGHTDRAVRTAAVSVSAWQCSAMDRGRSRGRQADLRSPASAEGVWSMCRMLLHVVACCHTSCRSRAFGGQARAQVGEVARDAGGLLVGAQLVPCGLDLLARHLFVVSVMLIAVVRIPAAQTCGASRAQASMRVHTNTPA